TSQDGTTIVVDRYGDGPPVIIVEGAFCDRQTSMPLAELLAPHFTVFGYDRRGRGDSGDTQPWAVEREIEDLAAIITEAGGSAFVYGMSSGALIGLEAAARGLGVRRLAMYEPPLDLDGTHAAAMVPELTRLVEAGQRGDAVAHFMANGPQIPGQVIAGMRTQPFWSGFEAIAHTLIYDNTIGGDRSVLQRAPVVTVPVLVMAGGDTLPALKDAAHALAGAVPGAAERTLDGQTHQVDVTLLAPRLIDFFDEGSNVTLLPYRSSAGAPSGTAGCAGRTGSRRR
ncbi:MAG TPA: alpha/beta hydrolase, partial [Actinophytocola sp.]|uniref:alpha/beta fold hydrolase n=1 Tax=Actinophytocola sp. TaxID=1872138 RepID=UPI002E062EAC|nr:alpha/beta hydrolase [Actinophytocola sp.]